MKRGKRIAILVLTVFFIFWFFPGKSFPLSCTASLKGLEGVEVLVEELKAELENFNLTMIQIQTDVEMKLRNAGIKVLSKEENETAQPLRKPYLYIKIHSHKPQWRKEAVAYNVEISLKQQVLIREYPNYLEKCFYAPTWYESVVGIVGWKNISEVREVVKDLTDKFIRAYLTANSKN